MTPGLTNVPLDLEQGDPDAAERIASAGSERSRARRSSRSSDSSSRSKSGSESGSKRSSSGQRTDSSLASRLGEAFSRLAEQLEARGDQELADAVRADGAAMSRGLVSLTRAVTFLRMPLLFVVNLAEPVLAFWHVGGILIKRWTARRAAAMAERDAAAANVAYEAGAVVQ